MVSPQRLLIVLLAAAMAVGGALWLRANPPGSVAILPSCFVRQATGLYCPGCGSTRACYLLTHGRPAEAFGMNPFVFLTIPIVAFGALLSAITWCTRGRVRPISWRAPPWLLLSLAIAIIAFTILRNIPHDPFRRLAPTHLPALVKDV